MDSRTQRHATDYLSTAGYAATPLLKRVRCRSFPGSGSFRFKGTAHERAPICFGQGSQPL